MSDIDQVEIVVEEKPVRKKIVKKEEPEKRDKKFKKAVVEVNEELVQESPEDKWTVKEIFCLRWFYIWFTKFIIIGFFKSPTMQDLPALSTTAKVENLEKRFDWIWGKLEGWPFRLILAINYTFGIEFWFGGLVQVFGIVSQVFIPKIMERFLKLLFLPEKDPLLVDSINSLREILPPGHEIYPDTADNFYRPNNWEAWCWVGGMVFVYIFSTWATAYAFHIGTTVGMKVRSLVVSKVYQKALVMSNKARDKYENGIIMNHCTMDAMKIDHMHMMFHYGWASWIMLFGSSYFLIDTIDWGALSGCLTASLIIPIVVIVIVVFLIVRLMVVKLIDTRVNKTNEVLQNIKIIKFFTWEDPFLKIISKIRFKEVAGTRFIYVLVSILIACMVSLTTFMALASFLTFYFVHDYIDPIAVFTSLTYFNMMRFPMLIAPMALIMTMEMQVSMNRIGKLLEAEELEEVKDGDDEKYPVVIKEGFFKWESKLKKKKDGENGDEESGKEKFKRKMKALGGKIVGCFKKKEEEEEGEKKEEFGRLDDISLNIQKGKLTAIVGGVGAGKSSFLNAILGEMKLLSGTIEVNGSIAYTDQSSWIQNCSLYNNVIFGEEENVEKWEKIVEVCSLTEDLKILKGGKNIEIGEKGINLSGGQKYRVQLARACYSNKDIVLLDDPLAAVDAHVGKHIFDKCIKGYLESKTRILVTHQLSYLKHCDYIVLFGDGQILEQGTYDELMKNEGDLCDLVSKYAEKEEEGQKAVKIPKKKKKEEKIAEEIELEEGEEEENKIIELEEQSTGVIHPRVFLTYFRNMGCCWGFGAVITIFIAFCIAQMCFTGSDWWLSEWSNARFNEKFSNNYYMPVYVERFDMDTMQPIIQYYVQSNFKMTNETNMTAIQQYLVPPRTNLTDMTLNCSIYGELSPPGHIVSRRFYSSYSDEYYCPSMYGYCGCFVNTMQVMWVKGYSNEDEKIEDGLTQMTSIYIYAGFGVLSLVIMFIRNTLFTTFALSSSEGLHKQALRSVLKAPMSFFDTTPIGRVVSRFSTDIANLDGIMVQAFMQACGMGFYCLGMFFMICYTTNGIGAAFVIPLLLLYVAFYVLYRKTNLELKRLEAVSKSPLLSHISETLNGLPTIRAYKANERFVEEIRYKINKNNRAYYLMMTAQRWLSLYLGLMGTIFIACVCCMCIILLYYAELDLKISYISLAISYSINATSMFFQVVEQVTQVEVQMNGVERLRFYAKNIPTEKAKYTNEGVIMKIGEEKWTNWPKTGDIEFKDYDMKYRKGLPLVLKNLNLKIYDKEKIGIVGRTGSGKSSLMMALFRIVEPHEGQIFIDGVSISTLGLYDLRKRLAIIPQDATLFSGTIRSNLDPFKEHSEDEMWDCLEKSFMKNKIEKLDEGLNFEVKEGGKNFSIGERQLLCLARAILRNAKILILDECTASVDLKTDSLIQMTIRKEFTNVTTLTIAHRLNTIIDSDRILVMDDGEVGEFDTPLNLVNKESSILRSLIVETGEANSQFLFGVARGEINLNDHLNEGLKGLEGTKDFEGIKEIEMQPMDQKKLGGEEEEESTSEDSSDSDSSDDDSSVFDSGDTESSEGEKDEPKKQDDGDKFKRRSFFEKKD